jgi:hypothetical protein
LSQPIRYPNAEGDSSCFYIRPQKPTEYACVFIFGVLSSQVKCLIPINQRAANAKQQAITVCVRAGRCGVCAGWVSLKLYTRFAVGTYYVVKFQSPIARGHEAN